ncbi:PREDICTED: ubiquitin carboxyl-terminal hydrolase 13-like [Camelina sativa]|uniref:Ubiquitin carboxyl-terminal hydrolase 13-like n=1 Tax=Camelina sativa TaxID=90675 RepID=A0ABM0Y9Y7_CAMSA|nr:PREDICTED: ubiquitin carboxyl-terminal hydrolase 13-like [Camelina sativa]
MGLKTSTSTLQDEVKYLCEELEKSLKGTAEEGTTQKLFEGHCRKAPDDNYTRKESFSSLGLDVTNCKDVYASFDKKCNGDIESGVLFTEFPPVLQLHLSRFQNDHGKINARYEYPLELDLDKENGKYLSTDADRSIRNLYTLHSVIVHNGDGHHFALIRPRLSDLWLKYDNEVVKIVDVRRALDEQYGGDEEFPPFTFTKGSNAIMLVYVRKSEKDKIFFTMDDEEIPEHARPKKAARLKKAEEIEDNQTDSFVIIKVARVQDEQTGTGLVDFDKVLSFRIKKLSSFYKFLEIVSEHYGVPTHRIRFYKSQACPIMPKKESDTVLQMVGDSPEVRLLLQFDKSPLCATCPCPGVGVFHVFDIEDWPRKSTM